MSKPQEVIHLKDVYVSFDGVPILENIHLIVAENDFLGVIGPNGGGKTTLIKVVLGLIKPQRGDVEILGVSPRQARRYIGYVPQVSLFDREFPINVWDTVLLGRLPQLAPLGRFTAIDKQRVEESLKLVGMLPQKDKQIGQLSEGQRQRVFIARALANSPKLLLLDEPTASVDTPMQLGLYDLLEKLKAKLTIVIISHDIGAVSKYVNKIACLNRTLFYHDSKEISAKHLEEVYQCPVDLIAHGVPHRVLKEHHDDHH